MTTPQFVLRRTVTFRLKSRRPNIGYAQDRNDQEKHILIELIKLMFKGQ